MLRYSSYFVKNVSKVPFQNIINTHPVANRTFSKNIKVSITKNDIVYFASRHFSATKSVPGPGDDVKTSFEPRDMELPATPPKITQHSKIKASTKKHVVDFVAFVEEISYMDKMRKSQEKVMIVKDALQKAGETKRDLQREMTNLRSRIQRNHNDMCTSVRGPDREKYIELVREESELLKMEKELQDHFSKADEEERYLFERLTTEISHSYENEKVHSNMLKTWGLIGTLFASVVTLIASVIGHYYHNTKFGLVAFQFKEDVNEKLKFEIGNLRESLRHDIMEQVSKMQEMKMPTPSPKTDGESWGSYFKRHSLTVYRWVTWQSSSPSKPNTESWGSAIYRWCTFQSKK